MLPHRNEQQLIFCEHLCNKALRVDGQHRGCDVYLAVVKRALQA
jgi:hypothetical protein